MADHPILFSTPMIRALFAGRKTITRRILKKQAALDAISVFGPDFLLKPGNSDLLKYSIGDQLWVREEHYRYGHWEPVTGVKTKTGRQKWAFSPDTDELLFDPPSVFRGGRHHRDPYTPAWHKRLGRFMFRRDSRLTLTVTGVKIERLQDISEADAIAEGIEPFTDFMPYGNHWKRYRDGGWNSYVDSPIASFASLWTEINGSGSWEANPWVPAYSFDVHHTNIDSMETSHETE